MKTRRAFSLIETITVMAVIAVLALILITVIGRVKATARSTTCLSNLRQVHVGIMGYVNDNDGYFPAVNMRPNGQGPWVQWWRLVQPYMGADNINGFKAYKTQQCPEVVEIAKEVMQRNDADILPNYGLNYMLGLQSNSLGALRGQSVRLSYVEEPSQTLLAGDNGVGVTSPMAPLAPDRVFLYGDKHPNGSNFVWIDGHVSTWQDVSTLAEEPYAPGGEKDVWTP